VAYHNRRRLTFLDGVVQFTLVIRRCRTPSCARYQRAYRPEEEGALALPHGEFGLDVIALVGQLRYREHRSAPELHGELGRRGVVLAERTVTNLIERYEELTGGEVRQSMEHLLAEIRDGQATVGTLQPAVAHFLKVSASYWPGLFHCYDVPGLPRTNNIPEHFFGSVRYHRRRASGRIRASAGTVVRGSVRALASAAARLHPIGEYELRHPDPDRWRDLRRSLDLRQEARRQQSRFRKDPAAYLAALENRLLKRSLPS